MSAMGRFVLISARRVAESKILPAYYTRQQIEQIFDIGKNYAGMLPLRVHKEETFIGHLLLTLWRQERIDMCMAATCPSP
jgi:hypothetical protein